MIAAAETIKGAAQALAALDVTAALAMLAAERDYVRPEIVAGLDFCIEGGRHPVVEQAMRDGGRSSPTTAISRRRAARTPAASTW